MGGQQNPINSQEAEWSKSPTYYGAYEQLMHCWHETMQDAALVMSEGWGGAAQPANALPHAPTQESVGNRWSNRWIGLEKPART